MEVFQRVTGETNPLVQLTGGTSRSIGFVYALDFESAKVLTNDYWKNAVSGVPLNAFLIATAFNPEDFGHALEIDQEVLLLRVIGPASLPMSSDNLKAMVEHYQRKTHMARVKGDNDLTFDEADGLDPYTRAELQFGGIDARVLGTFYMHDGQLHLGADIENFAAASSLRVYKPTEQALEQIVNFVDPIRLGNTREDALSRGFKHMPEPFRLGTVRYSSTDRLHRRRAAAAVPLKIHPSDFLGRRTAVFGMTRTGKSNTVKTMVSAVALAATRQQVPVGQVIFDLNGEYANANNQDAGSSIAEALASQTVRYRGIDTPNSDFQDLRNNFYQSPQIGLSILQPLVRESFSSPGGDLGMFLEMSLEQPDQSMRGDWERWRRHIACFCALLYRASYPCSPSFRVQFSAAEEVRNLIYRNGPEFDEDNESDAARDEYCPDPSKGLTPAQAGVWFERARHAARQLEQQEKDRVKNGDPRPKKHRPYLAASASDNPWFDPQLRSMVNLLVERNELDNRINGVRLLARFTQYHSAKRNGDVEAEIYAHLEAGRIVILDLSVGTLLVRNTMAERIASHIFQRSMNEFHSGRRPPNLVMYVEEAHNLIGKTADLDQTWPRIAKEGAKAQIALVYATQEPSSIHPNIMSNTENFFVTHLNNDDELRSLGKFYDFADFALSIKRAQDVGFARVKTLSSPFVVPIQIDKFDPAEVKKRAAGGGTPAARGDFTA